MNQKLTFICDMEGKLSKYRCECGEVCVKNRYKVNSGRTKSCGCAALKTRFNRENKTTHGESYTAEYKTWIAIRRRCHDPKNSLYHKYGAKGIEVCPEWRGDYSKFLLDMGRRPEGFQIDRINGSLGYSPENCRWASTKTQAVNRSSTKFVETEAGRMHLKAAASHYGVHYESLRYRLAKGMSLSDALQSICDQITLKISEKR